VSVGEAVESDCPIPQQLHLDDPEEPLRVYADPAGHPFCIIAAI
jgi:hypothetical protein